MAKGQKKRDYSDPHQTGNGRQEKFIRAIIAGKTQHDAYLEAYPRATTWKPNSIDCEASKLITKFSPRIAMLQSKAVSSKVMTKQRAMEILTEIGETDLSDFLTVGADGVTFFDFGKDTTKKKALKKAKTRTQRDEAGNTITETMFQEIELESKIPTIERLAKMLDWDSPEKQDITLKTDTLSLALADIAAGKGTWIRRRSPKNGLPK